MSTAQPLLSVTDLKVHFPTGTPGETVKAVDGVSLSVAAGETLGVIGESGSGKSTLARVVAALQKPTSGTVSFRGIDLFSLPSAELRRRRAEFQMIFQDPHAALDPRMRIVDSVREPMEIMRRGKPAEIQEAALAMLARVGIGPDLAYRYPHEASGGQKQRVNIARALTLRPTLLICDEVTAALDVSIQADILNLFLDLQAEFALTYVYITHDLGVATHVCDRIGVMYLGRLMEYGPTRTIAHASRHPYTRALLAAEPVVLPSRLRLARTPPLEGELPSPISPPSGCRFRTRCPMATDRCAAEEPAWRLIEDDHLVACHYAEDVGGQSADPRASAVAMGA